MVLFQVIHVGAHCFNFENLTMSWYIKDKLELNNKLQECHNWFRPIENGSVVSSTISFPYLFTKLTKIDSDDDYQFWHSGAVVSLVIAIHQITVIYYIEFIYYYNIIYWLDKGFIWWIVLCMLRTTDPRGTFGVKTPLKIRDFDEYGTICL